MQLITDSDDEEDDTIENDDIKIPKDTIWENYFEDTEKLTTVTVIEDFEQGGLEAAQLPINSGAQDQERTSTTQPTKSEKPVNDKKKKKAFRYGTKAERQAERRKAKLKKHGHSKSQKRK